jgi:sterol desaturase/sphingolipid hydroxylase (fatty acid hydroxylase superfamily)
MMGCGVVKLYQGGSRNLRVLRPAGLALRRLLHPLALAVVGGHLLLLTAAWLALRLYIPDTVVLRLFGHVHVVSEVHRRLIDRAVVAGVLAPGVFLVEYLWMGCAESSVRHLLVQRTPSGRADVVCFLASLAPPMTLLSAAMSLGVVFVSSEWLRLLIAHKTGLGLSIASAPLAAQTAILFLLYSLFDYWSHRLDHSRLFWPLHRFHHAAEDFSVLTAARTHPAVFTAVVGTTLPGLLLGAAPEALGDLGILVITLRLLIHSRIESDLGWIGRWVIQSPRHHRLHHNLNRRPVNLALTPVWDRLFGTWREAPAGPLRIGVTTPYRQGAWVWPDMWRDYCDFWKGMGRLAFGGRENTASAPSVANELQS